MSKYKIYIDEDNVIVARHVSVYPAKEFYFDAGEDEEGAAQELYDLLKSAGADVERVEG